MKRLILILTCSLTALLQAGAGFNIAKGVYRIDELETAQAKAQTESKPLTFMYSETKTTCGLCSSSSEKVMDGLRKRSVMVYLDITGEEFSKAPDIVREALRAPESGKYIPKTVTFDPDLSKVIAYTPYARGKEQDNLISKTRRAISKADFEHAEPSEHSETSSASALRVWTDTRGRTIEAELAAVNGNQVTLKRPDGNVVNIPVRLLSHNDQVYISSNNP